MRSSSFSIEIGNSFAIFTQSKVLKSFHRARISKLGQTQPSFLLEKQGDGTDSNKNKTVDLRVIMSHQAILQCLWKWCIYSAIIIAIVYYRSRVEC